MNPWNFESNFTEVCYAGLTALAIPHGAERGQTEQAQERVEVVGSAFVRASGQMAQSNSGTWFYNHRTGRLAFSVITQVSGDNAANHNVWLANIRQMMDGTSQLFTANNLPCYRMLRVAEVGADPDERPASDAFVTTLAFAVEFTIVGSAVP